MAESDHYACRQIVALEGLEPVRLRPGMYVGDVHDGSGLHNLLWCAVDNVIDLHVARRASWLRVDVRDPWVEIEDDGPGMPMCYVGSTGKRAVTRALTEVCGLGLAVVNALSAELELETHSGGRIWRQRFEQGRPICELTSYGPTARTGTRLRFRPDPAIFSTLSFDHASIEARLRELAYLNPAINLRLGESTFRERLGLGGWARQLLGSECPVIEAHRVAGLIRLDVAFGWSQRGRPQLRAFGDQAPRKQGWPDSHVMGFWDGLRHGFIAHFGRELRRIRPTVLRELVSSGLVAILDITGSNQPYHSWRYTRIEEPEIRWLTRSAVSEALKRKLMADESFAAEMAARFNPAGRCARPFHRSQGT